MKNFNYFGITKSGMGMTEGIQTTDDLSKLRGWMSGDCRHDDKKMLKWMGSALVGQKYRHRLGYLVRMMDV